MTFRRFLLPITLSAVLAVLAACSSNPAFEEGRRLVAEGRHEDGILRMEQGTRDRPEDIEARNQYYRQREIWVGRQISMAESAKAAGKLEEAEVLYRGVFRIDPMNSRAQGSLAEIASARRHQMLIKEAEALVKNNEQPAAENMLRVVLTENPAQADASAMLRRLREEEARTRPVAQGVKSPFSKPITLEFRETPLKGAFEVMSRVADINFVLDKEVKGDTKITVFFRNTSVEDALRLILVTNQLERKLLNDNSVLIYPNTPAKSKDYQETVVKSFYISNADVKQAQALIRSIIKSKDLFVDEKLNLLVIKDTPEAVQLAERLIESLDLALPEVMLEVEVLEVSRNRLLNLGLQFPDQVGYGRLTPDTTAVTTSSGTTVATSTAFGGSLTPGFISLKNTSGLTGFVANPAVILNLKKQDGDSKILANPRIRVINREKAKIHIGDKLPVFTTTSTANVGVSASVSYLDVGLKLEVEPTVHLDANVEMKVGLEVSSIVKEVPGPTNSLAYQVGTRSATTSLRLRDGETQVLAGLINDEERSSANRVPGLGDIPLLGRLFSSQSDSKNKTEIVLLITPRIIRNVTPPSVSAPVLLSGTETAIGASPLSIKAGNLRGVSAMGSSGRIDSAVPFATIPITAPAESLPAGGVAEAISLPLSLTVPPQAKAGQQITVTMDLPIGSGARGQVDLSIDPNFFQSGPSKVTLVPSDSGLRGEATLKVASKARGQAVVQVTGANVVDVIGMPVAIALPGPQPVSIQP